MDRAILDALGVERRARRAAFVITPLGDGEPRLVKAAEIAGDPDAERLATALRLVMVSDGAHSSTVISRSVCASVE